MSEFRSVMGENPAPVIAKACLEPDKITPDEQVVLTAYYNLKIAHIERLRVLELVAEFGVPWPMLAREQLARVLETEAGRSRFEQRFRVDTELYAIGQTLLQTDTDCRDRYSKAAAEVDRSFIESQRNAVDARSA